MSRVTRTVYSLLTAGILTIFSLTYYTIQITDSLFPYLSMSVTSVSILLFFLVLSRVGTDRLRSLSLLFASTVLILYSVILSYNHSASLIGIDPDVYALWGYQTAVTGDSSIAASSFYSHAPVFHTYLAQLHLVTDIPFFSSVLFVSLIIAAGFPVFAYVFTFRFSGSYDSAAIAAILGSLMAVHVEISFWPIAQSVGIVYFLLFCFFIVFNVANYRTEIVLTIVIVTLLLFTHKFTLFATILVLAPLSVYEWYSSRIEPQFRRAKIGSITVFTIIFLILQWTFTTQYVSNVLVEFYHIFTLGGDESSIRSTATGAIFPEMGNYVVFTHNIEIVSLLAASGLAWSYLAIRHRNRMFRLLITASCFAGATVILGILYLLGSSAANYSRVFLVSTVFLIALVACALSSITRSASLPTKAVASSILLTLIVFQAFSAAAVIDYPGQWNPYLTEAEFEGKVFVEDHSEGTVHSDTLYVHKVVDFERYSGGIQTSSAAVLYQRPGPRYRIYDECLFDRVSCDVGTETVLYRPGNDVYRAGGDWEESRYELTWDPSDFLSERKNRIYSSEEVEVYHG